MGETVFGVKVARRLHDRAALRQRHAEPSRYVNAKVIDHVDDLAARFIAAAPLAILATRRGDGSVDLTPRGDPPGFVQVLDGKTLALPDRPGNNRVDAFENVLIDDGVGLLFLIPGHGDTLRVSGRAAIVEDAALSDRLSVNGRPSGLVMLISVARVLCHCPKAFIRSGAWQPERWPDTGDVPSLAEMMKVHGAMDDTLDHLDAVIERSNTERLY